MYVGFYDKMSEKRILVLQTCDDKSKYNEMLDVTSEVNKRYCTQHGYAYGEFRGIKRGVYPWHATFNRMYLIEEIITNYPKYDWVVYIDADAMVVDFTVKIETFIQNANAHDKVILIDGYGSPGESYKINAGIFIFNLKHEASMNLIQLWKHSCEIMISSNDLIEHKSHSVPTKLFLLDDQFSLMCIFDMLTRSERFSRIVCRLLKKKLSSFIIQELRPNNGINVVNIEGRIHKLREKREELGRIHGFDL
jgi:hypothetical protein